LAQARNKWGHNAAAAIWDAAIVKVILGGNAETADLRDMSTLIGERDETITSDTRTETGGLSTSRSIRRVQLMPPENNRTLPTGTAITLLRTTRPIVTDLRPWHKRSDAPQLAADRADIETILEETQLRQQARPPGT
jgi:type IV secretory pathway TraG/TraD family ATPase VirD4